MANISGLEPSSVIIDPKYLKLFTISSFCPITLTFVLMPCVLFVISLVFSALISMPYEVVFFLSRRSTKLASYCSSPAKPSKSSAKRRLVIVLPPMLTVHWFGQVWRSLWRSVGCGYRSMNTSYSCNQSFLDFDFY